MNKKLWKLETFRFFLISGVNLRRFHLEKGNKLIGKANWSTRVFSLLALFRVPIQNCYQKFGEKMHKFFENWKVLGFFVIFSVNLRFFILNKKLFFGKIYWTTNHCHVGQFQHSNSRSLSKIWQKMHRNVKNWELLEVLSFLGLFISKKGISLFINDYWTTNSCLVELFQNFKPRHLSKNWQK